MRLSALEVKKKEFQQKMRGLDSDEVQSFLALVSAEMEDLVRERQESEDKRLIIEEKLSHYLNLESTLERTLVAAQQTAMKMEEQAKREADLILKEAELQRDKRLGDIRSDLEKANFDLMRVRSEYESTLSRLRAILDGFGRFIQSVESEQLSEAKTDLHSNATGPESARVLASL